jgi:hypothetical protein
VVLFEALPAARRESFTSHGWPVEVFCHDLETLAYFFDRVDAPDGVPSLASMVVQGYQLRLQAGDVLDRAITLARASLTNGPPPWTTRQLTRIRYALTDIRQDIRAPRSPAELTASCAKLHGILADAWFRGAGRWSASGKSIPGALYRADPDFARRFDQAFTQAFAEHDPSHLIALIDVVLEPLGGELFDGASDVAPADWRLPLARAS